MSKGGVDHVTGLVHGTTVSRPRTASAYSNLGRWLPIERSTELAAEATAPPERRGGRSPEFGLPVAPEL